MPAGANESGPPHLLTGRVFRPSGRRDLNPLPLEPHPSPQILRNPKFRPILRQFQGLPPPRPFPAMSRCVPNDPAIRVLRVFSFGSRSRNTASVFASRCDHRPPRPRRGRRAWNQISARGDRSGSGDANGRLAALAIRMPAALDSVHGQSRTHDDDEHLAAGVAAKVRRRARRHRLRIGLRVHPNVAARRPEAQRAGAARATPP